MTEPDPNPLERIERRLERLTSVVIVQCILLTAIVLLDVLRLAPYVVLLLLIAVPLLVFYRDSLPALVHRMARAVRRLTSAVRPSPSEEKSS